MKKIIISLREQPYNDLIAGNKKFEYRKKWISDDCIAYVYVSEKTQKILLKIKFGFPIYKDKEEIAKIARTENKNWYNSTLDYFKKYKYGFAIPIISFEIIKNPKSLAWMKINNLNPPQGYIFLEEEMCNKIEN